MQTLLNPVLGEMNVDLRPNCKACHRRIKKTEYIVVRDAMKTCKKAISRSIIFSCTPQERQTSNKISALFTNKREQSAKNCRKKPQKTKKFEKRSPSKYHFLYSSGETDTKRVTVRSVSKSITSTVSNSNLPFSKIPFHASSCVWTANAPRQGRQQNGATTPTAREGKNWRKTIKPGKLSRSSGPSCQLPVHAAQVNWV